MRTVRLAPSYGVTFNLTAMVDVVFQLIVFFLCISAYQRENRLNESIRLPEAERAFSKDEKFEPSRVIVNILPNLQIKIDEREVKILELAPYLKKRRESITHGDLEVWVRADRFTPYQSLKPIFHACSEAGVQRLSLKVVSKH